MADDYDRVRPGPPDEALDWLVPKNCQIAVDIAAGTGLFTRALRRRVADVIAVEPDERMRAVHGAALPGSAEAIPLEDASVDAVFVGEAFHWFDPAAAIPELVRVLRPRGGVAVVGTHWWETEPPLPDAALELLHEP